MHRIDFADGSTVTGVDKEGALRLLMAAHPAAHGWEEEAQDEALADSVWVWATVEAFSAGERALAVVRPADDGVSRFEELWLLVQARPRTEALTEEEPDSEPAPDSEEEA